MSERSNSLEPPEREGLEDPGAHELESSDSDDHFSDAHSGPAQSPRSSPIPKTRVERVDGNHCFGEVPGTEAYQKRAEDAAPDEIAVVSNSSPSSPCPRADEGTPSSSEGKPIPKTVVERTADSDGSVTHPELEEKHKADPSPDLVLNAGPELSDGGQGDGGSDSQISANMKSPSSVHSRRKSSLALQASSQPSPRGLEDDGSSSRDAADDFGDDFDDFEEGGEDAEFGDFDDGFEEPEGQSARNLDSEARKSTTPAAFPFPIPDFQDLGVDHVGAAIEPYLDALFPPSLLDTPTLPPPSSKDDPVFQTPRSASLWSQLVAPPPLQPPDWIRSRIRRLFLVSLGVPVDLDEIHPTSKQKKLILPLLHRTSSSGSLRAPSSEFGGRSPSPSKLRVSAATNASSTSVDSQGRPTAAGASSSDGKAITPGGRSDAAGTRKPRSAEPIFDLVAARQLCATTDEALDGMTDHELRKHVAKLERMEGTAKEVLEYWKKRTDEKIGDREAFEGVIENLVKHARKVRK
ncbi:hypothetical protein VTK73DRAFT_3237 [Phialemonium thermophilum]|uniref:Uncharacterized protein n=1 Tax=Phialemonium thermophilum TaxID=223376 RepID=A0ABR3Y862_9PEZI